MINVYCLGSKNVPAVPTVGLTLNNELLLNLFFHKLLRYSIILLTKEYGILKWFDCAYRMKICKIEV